MRASIRRWPTMRDSASVQYGPLTFSLKIGEEYRRVDSKDTAISDSGWHTLQIRPNGPPTKSFRRRPGIERFARGFQDRNRSKGLARRRSTPSRSWLVRSNLKSKGNKFRAGPWDENGLAAVLPMSPVTTSRPADRVESGTDGARPVANFFVPRSALGTSIRGIESDPHRFRCLDELGARYRFRRGFRLHRAGPGGRVKFVIDAIGDLHVDQMSVGFIGGAGHFYSRYFVPVVDQEEIDALRRSSSARAFAVITRSRKDRRRRDAR